LVKPSRFEWVEAASLSEALQALSEFGEEGKVLAGGQSLVPLVNMRLAQPDVLIDINRVSELSFMREDTRDGTPGLVVGAMTRQNAVEEKTDLTNRMPLLQQAIAWVGHPQIRNRGTVGGSIAHADPAAELPLVFCALDGIATVQTTRGQRQICADQFFLYAMTSAIEPDELLTEVWLPFTAPNTGTAFCEVARRHGDFALVAAAVTLTIDGDAITGARIAVGGAGPIPFRASEAEELVVGRSPDADAWREAGRLVSEACDPTADIHADAEYRRDVASTLVFDALVLAHASVQMGKA
jgi:CO/xanthine dehydrogenase FAD-binding subunit